MTSSFYTVLLLSFIAANCFTFSTAAASSELKAAVNLKTQACSPNANLSGSFVSLRMDDGCSNNTLCSFKAGKSYHGSLTFGLVRAPNPVTLSLNVLSIGSVNGSIMSGNSTIKIEGALNTTGTYVVPFDLLWDSKAAASKSLEIEWNLKSNNETYVCQRLTKVELESGAASMVLLSLVTLIAQQLFLFISK